jgi:hypothetical protein
MAYQTGSATGQTDLFSKLNTFAAANGYTTDYHNGTNRFLALSRSADGVYVTFYWDGVDHVALYQALGFSATYQEQPWNQANDSGNGNSVLGSISTGRHVNLIGNGPFPTYHFFAYTNPYAIHVVLEFSAGLYRHFGFGKINKETIWTGGAFCYGHHWAPEAGFSIFDDPTNIAHSIGMDNLFQPQGGTYASNVGAGGTLHVEGLPNQPSGGKWGHACREATDDLYVGTDRASVQRVRISGSWRAGIPLAQYGWLLPDLSNGFIPIVPMLFFYHDGDASSTPNDWYYLGSMPNIGHIHLEGIDPAQVITVGADDWVAFPGVRKAKVGSNNQESWNMGIIYRKEP